MYVASLPAHDLVEGRPVPSAQGHAWILKHFLTSQIKTSLKHACNVRQAWLERSERVPVKTSCQPVDSEFPRSARYHSHYINLYTLGKFCML